MAEKRKPTNLTIEKKYEILQKLNSRQTPIDVAIKFNITLDNVNEIYEQRKEILNYFKMKGRPVQVQDIERIVYEWYIGCEKNNIKLTRKQIRDKALEFNKTLNGSPSIIASIYWAKNYMRRYNINQEDSDKYQITNRNTVNIFLHSFKELLESEEYKLQNVYNVSYTPLMWRAVPEKTWIFQNENHHCPQMYKDHVITFLCANVTGCHKLPVLIIGKIAKTEGSYNLNMNASSTTYTGNASNWVDNKVFNMWFEKYFLESIKEKHRIHRRKEKTLLLLNNARWHYSLEDINKKYEFIRVMTFPYDIAPLIEPMDCGIIECFRRMYRKELLETLMPLPNCNKQDNVVKNHNDLILWDCCRMIQDAWSNVKNAAMINGWHQILNCQIEQHSSTIKNRNMEQNVVETLELLSKLPGCESCLKDHIKMWFQADKFDTMVMKVYSDIVIRDFRKEIMEEAKCTVDDEAGPSRKRANIVQNTK